MRSCAASAGRHDKPHQASVLVCVLVCLAIATSLVTSTVHNALVERRTMRTQHHLRQTELLLAAGIQRAAEQLHNSTDYLGETWEVTPAILANVESAQVTIAVTPDTEETERAVQVVARLSTGPHTEIKRTYQFSINLE